MITTEKISSGICSFEAYDEPVFLYSHTGKVSLLIDKTSCCFLSAGSLTLLPSGFPLAFSSSEDTIVIVIRLSRIGNLYRREQYMFNRLSASFYEKNNYPSFSRSLSVLRCDSPLRNFMDGLVIYVNSGIDMSLLYESKIKELFCLLRLSYSEKELEKLFIPSDGFSKDASFIRLVKDNYTKYDSAYQLANALNYSYSGFAKKFRQIFGMSVYQWMKEHKAKQVYAAILNDDIPLKEVSYKLGFPSLPNFYKFCNSNFGRPPGEIRKDFKIRI